ncbi:MAG: TerD family protein [Thermoguttaceae bacterium]|nr:TerD family protein [Thermoguttaceae bacterium]
MALTLVKGQNTQLDPGLIEVMVGLGWDERADAGDDFDLDASAFMLNSLRKVRSDDDFIFYHQLESKCGSVQHQGDNLTGAGDGDCEQIKVNLPNVPADIERIVFTVTIYQAKERKQNFGMVDNAYIRIVDLAKNEEIARFDLTEDACVNQSILFGELYRRDGAWKFKALGQGFDYDLGVIARNYGVNI